MDEEMKNQYALGGVPVITGSTAERFERICEYNAKHLSGTEYSKEREEWVKKITSKLKR